MSADSKQCVDVSADSKQCVGMSADRRGADLSNGLETVPVLIDGTFPEFQVIKVACLSLQINTVSYSRPVNVTEIF